MFVSLPKISLTQSAEIPFLGITLKREQLSYTQCNYCVLDAKGNLIFSAISAEAPYNNESMCHVKNDGRANMYLATDQEIINGFSRLLVDLRFNPKVSRALRPAINDALKNKLVRVPAPARDHEGKIIEGRFTEVVGRCEFVGINLHLDNVLQITINRMPIYLKSYLEIEVL